MKDPRRLLDGDGTPEQRALLYAGTREEPPREASARLLAALGVAVPSAGPEASSTHEASSGGGAAAESAGAGESASAHGTTTGGLGASGGGLGAIGAGKLALLSIGSAALVGAGALLWSRGAEPEASSNAGAKSSTHSTDSAQGSEASQASHASHAREPAPAIEAKAQPTEANAQATGSVALEIGALEQVRSDLARKDGRAALGALASYARKHPSGVLAHEAEVLRVEALLVAGDEAAALALATRLLEQHRDSPHRARLTGLLRQASTRSTP